MDTKLKEGLFSCLMIDLKHTGESLLSCIFIFMLYHIGSLLIYSCTVTPFRIAFAETDPLLWVITDAIVDILFAIDIFINFTSAYFDPENNLITEKKKIIINYALSWFLIDFIAVFPFALLLQTQKDYSSLVRLARLPRLYKMVKITK